MSKQTSEYLLLFRGTDYHKGLSPEQMQQVMDRMKAWIDRLSREGRLKGAQPLEREGKTISGKSRVVSDGPFAVSKEAIGGYLLLQAGSFEEAVAIGKETPGLDYGVTVEVRPVAEECPMARLARGEPQLAQAGA